MLNQPTTKKFTVNPAIVTYAIRCSRNFTDRPLRIVPFCIENYKWWKSLPRRTNTPNHSYLFFITTCTTSHFFLTFLSDNFRRSVVQWDTGLINIVYLCRAIYQVIFCECFIQQIKVLLYHIIIATIHSDICCIIPSA